MISAHPQGETRVAGPVSSAKRFDHWRIEVDVLDGGHGFPVDEYSTQCRIFKS